MSHYLLANELMLALLLNDESWLRFDDDADCAGWRT